MPIEETTNIPLQNLFAYLRDLFQTVVPCYDFEDEKNNKKIQEVNYWQIGKLKTLARLCSRKNISEFSLAIDDASLIQEYFLKIKRIAVPTEPVVPFILKDWVTIDYSKEIPSLSFFEAIEVEEQFTDSKIRVKEFEKISSLKEGGFEINPILDGWLKFDKEGSPNYLIRKNVLVRFGENADRIFSRDEFTKHFNAYYEAYATHLKVNKLFDALHSLNYDLKGKDDKRLYISFGLLHGKIGEEFYKNFLFNVPLKIYLKKQEIKIELDTFANRIFAEQYFSDLLIDHFKEERIEVIEARKNEILEQVELFNSAPVEFSFDKDLIRNHFYNSALAITATFARKEDVFFANEQLDFEFKPFINNRQLTFSFSPILQTKFVDTKFDISRDAQNIIHKINELESLNNLDLIPDFFKKLFSLEAKSNTTDVEGATAQPLLSNEDGATLNHSLGNQFLFPLPYNDEQFEIAKRLELQDAVTVKGPPGTGKSHTIANIIAHFVAQGKSILVVSHNAKALNVIKDKLPKGIQELAISLVDEGNGNDLLKGSVDAIIKNISRTYSDAELNEIERSLEQLEKNFSETMQRIYDTILANQSRLELVHPLTKEAYNKTAQEWAQDYFEHNEYPINFIKDELAFDADTEGLAEKIDQFLQLSKGVALAEFDLLDYSFLEDNNFLSSLELRKLEQQVAEIYKVINPEEYQNIDVVAIDNELKELLAAFEGKWTVFQQSNFCKLLIQQENFSIDRLSLLLENYSKIREQIKLNEDKLLDYHIELGLHNEVDPDVLSANIKQLVVKFGENNTLSWFTKSLLDKNLKLFLDCKLNSIETNQLEQIKILEIEIERRRLCKQLNITFGNYLKSLSIEKPDDIQVVLKNLDFIVSFFECIRALNQKLTLIGLPMIDINDEQVFSTIVHIKNLDYVARYNKIQHILKLHQDSLIAHGNNHPLLYKITDSIQSLDVNTFESTLDSYRSLRLRQQHIAQIDLLLTEIKERLPITAQFLKENLESIQDITIKVVDIEFDFFHLKVIHFLDEISKQTNASKGLISNLQMIKSNIGSKIAELVVFKAWYNKSISISDTEKAALNAWKNDLINIGKGYGKNTERNRSSAIKNMQVAKDAVPIWIMKQESAITFFPNTTPNQFDLLIIDEASQCDISSLNLIFRCKKCLIVGDENQTSVATDRSFFTIEKTNGLLDKFLYTHKFKSQFDVNNKNNSIYTISGVIYPNIVTLTEHFRCLPEIIGYSNKFVYNSDIIPLKTATENIFGSPLELHYIEDDFNNEAKPNIVAKVVQTIEEYIQRFQNEDLNELPTIGILSLDSSNTKHKQLLQRKILERPLIKQFEDKLALLIGTAREFQGDERDIMLLTITASHSIVENQEGAELRPPRAASSEENMRVFNVAASRAKEKSIVLHSIHPDAIPMINPDCYRKKMLDYYQGFFAENAVKTSIKNLDHLLSKVDANSGDFEQGVCKLLYNNNLGDYLHPQFRVSKYVIDFGIIMNNKKLAIECDGFTYHSGFAKIQEDMKRQLILERAGWKFFRIQRTDWFYQNEKVSKELIEWIKSQN